MTTIASTAANVTANNNVATANKKTAKNTVNINGVTVNGITAAEIKKAAKGIAAAENKKASDIKAERKTIAATLNHIASSDSAECAEFRAFLNLPKNANKAARKACAAWLSARYINVCRKVYVTVGDESDAVNVEVSGVEPCNAKGRPYADAMDAIRDVKKAYAANIAQRNKIARKIIEVRNTVKNAGNYGARAIDAIKAQFCATAPAKYQPQKTHGDFAIRK